MVVPGVKVMTMLVGTTADNPLLKTVVRPTLVLMTGRIVTCRWVKNA